MNRKMSRPLLGDDSPKHMTYSAIPTSGINSSKPLEVNDQRTIEEAAAAMRDRLPGRSRKAKGRFRRQQRGQKGDEWRGRLTCYCEASSYDLEKLTSKLKEEFLSQPGKMSSRLYSTRWQVKAHFDALHLKASAYTKHPILAKNSSLRNIPAGQTSTSETHSYAHQQQHPSNTTPSQADLTGYHTYDTEISDNEGGGGGGGGGGGSKSASAGQDAANAQDIFEDDTVDVFLFAFGPVVFWGFTDEQEEREMLRDLRLFVDGTFHDLKAADDAMEEMEFTYRETSRITNDIVELATSKSGEKLSVSSAVAQSCHLSVHEWRLSQTINRNNHIPKELAETGFIQMSHDEISKEIGRLFLEKTLVNLEPELLDTPEFLWQDATFESTYDQMYRYLEIGARLDTINKRLSIVGELLDVLRSQQEHMHANKLEWVIIVLVAMEVILQLVWNILLKDVLGWVGLPRSDDEF